VKTKLEKRRDKQGKLIWAKCLARDIYDDDEILNTKGGGRYKLCGAVSHVALAMHLDFSCQRTKTDRVNISDVTAKQLRQAANLRERIDSLQDDLNRILGNSVVRGAKAPATTGARTRRSMSAGTKAKLAAIARARWKKAKAQGKKVL
jgi:hypothetical protein